MFPLTQLIVTRTLIGAFAMAILSVPLCVHAAPSFAFQQSFLEHLAKNAPAGKSDCYVQAVQRHWPSQAAVTRDADKIRLSRGETDVVNFAIKRLAAECSLREKK